MKKYLVYANLDKVSNYLIRNGHAFKFETDYPKPLIEFTATADDVNDMQEELARGENVYPVFYEK